MAELVRGFEDAVARLERSAADRSGHAPTCTTFIARRDARVALSPMRSALSSRLSTLFVAVRGASRGRGRSAATAWGRGPAGRRGTPRSRRVERRRPAPAPRRAGRRKRGRARRRRRPRRSPGADQDALDRRGREVLAVDPQPVGGAARRSRRSRPRRGRRGRRSSTSRPASARRSRPRRCSSPRTARCPAVLTSSPVASSRLTTRPARRTRARGHSVAGLGVEHRATLERHARATRRRAGTREIDHGVLGRAEAVDHRAPEPLARRPRCRGRRPRCRTRAAAGCRRRRAARAWRARRTSGLPT